MALALSIFGVGFAAFCVWLTVRIVNRRKKPGKAFWATVVVVMMMLYPLSVGPAEWMQRHDWIPAAGMTALKRFYIPLAWLETHSEKFGRAMFWYEQLWVG